MASRQPFEIALHGAVGRGSSALVDRSFAARVAKYRWVAIKKVSGVYAVTYIKRKRGFRPLYLHQLVLSHAPEHVDHRNGNTLDCRRKNLREATTKQNIRNSRKWRRKTTSAYKGVFYTSDRNGRVLARPWRACIRPDGKAVYLGRFATEQEAARAYDGAARKFFGEFACTNFPVGDERAAVRLGANR